MPLGQLSRSVVKLALVRLGAAEHPVERASGETVNKLSGARPSGLTLSTRQASSGAKRD
jgi:hypothetical protein